MSLTYGFYNSLNGDRKYDAIQMSQIFDGIIRDGVFMSIGDALMVKAAEGMTVSVGLGRAWFNHTWTYNDSQLILTIEDSELLLDRIDAVVLRINSSDEVRENSIYVIKGSPASVNPERPTLTKTDAVHEYPLCYISVKRNCEEITQADITNMVGTSECPFVTGILETMNIDALVSQWESQWTNWMSDMNSDYTAFKTEFESDFTSWSASHKNDFDEWSDTQKNSFENWFSALTVILDGDVAANLANQILSKASRPEYVYSSLLSSKWENGSYSFEEDYPSNSYDIDISPADTCTEEEINLYGRAKIVGNANSNVIKALGIIPQEDIPIIIKAVSKA